MDDLNNGGSGQMPDAGGQDVFDTIMNPSAGNPAGPGGKVDLTDSTQGNRGSEAYKFAGREWKGGQSEAEKWAKQMYGKYSETQGFRNQIEKALKGGNPELLQTLANDPEWAPILGKLGIQAAEQEIEREDSESPEVTHQTVMQELYRERARTGLEREAWQFERQLGKTLSDDEWNATMKMIQKASSLSFSEAYKLANHDRLIAELSKKQAQNTPARNAGSRPKPLPRGIPGTNYDMSKKPEEMGADEFREHIRNSPEFQKLLSRE